MLGMSDAVLRARDEALAREWLVPNGLGGYAAASAAGTTTRAYHGLLVGALRPPGERMTAVSHLEGWAEVGGHRYALSMTEYPGTFAAEGSQALSESGLDGATPVLVWSMPGARLEQRVRTAHGQNTTYVQFRMLEGQAHLHLAPLVTMREQHARTRGYAHWRFHRWEEQGAVRLEAFPDAPAITLATEPQVPLSGPAGWHWQVHRRWEARRGYAAEEDLYCPGAWDIDLGMGATFTVILSLEPPAHVERDVAAMAQRERSRVEGLIKRLGPEAATDPFLRQLALAADAFVVRFDGGTAALAGYPWHGVATRDLLIALPGLTLATGRPELAAAWLRLAASKLQDGMLPDRLDGDAAGSSSADLPLWFLAALDAYIQATGDNALLRELYPAAEAVFRSLAGVSGQRQPGRMRLDRDGLLTIPPHAGQYTWMNAHAGGAPVTPRWGKPVEVNALWLHGVLALERWGERAGQRIQGLGQLAQRIRGSFNERFWYAPGGYLYDVVDGPDGDDPSLRPNQLFALSLPDPALDEKRCASVFEAVSGALLTPVGLRTLAPTDQRYRAYYEGGPEWREQAAHQGSVWPWLMGPYVDAAVRLGMDPLRLRALFPGLQADLARGALGTLGEAYDGAAPHLGGGAPAFAMSVAEVLRAWRRTQEAPLG
ncbi:MAG: glycogen debranching enzyme N-terminal domain-containing protein [Chloroflexi bacterium]|nr:glycogen debranching enzyme N-terminal domain-containing protein [Chloroflexota bacterium]